MPKVALDLTDDIQPVSEFRANTASMLRQIQETGRPLVLTQNGRSAAVILDPRSYQRLLEENELLRDIQAGLADVEAGRAVSHEDVRRAMADRYPG